MFAFALLLCFSLDFRGIWIPRWSIEDHDKILSTLDGRFNHVFLQVFALGEAYYPSDYAPVKRYDDGWLRDFLTEAHRRNIKVSAWVNVFYSWGYAARTKDHRHPINLHPNWYVVDRTGRSILGYSIEELKRQGIEGYYLTPANAQVNDYMLAIITELLEKYDFDGVHLDYFRYPSRRFIHDVSLTSKFMRAFCVDPANFASTDFERRFSVWGSTDLNNRFQALVRDELTGFITLLNRRLKNLKPYVELSIAVKADYQSAAVDFYQDWSFWLNRGLVDYVCLMAYSRNIGATLNKTLKVVNDPHKVAVGLGVYVLSTDQIAAQVRQVASMPFAGVVFFSYEEVKKNRSYLDILP